ncbi:MAG: B12-binding domain-containing radical SAM protein, partial [Nanoarchaeota archaeon]
NNWSLYDAQHVVMKPKNMSPEELQEGHHWAWKQTYSFSNIFKRMIGARILPHVVIPANIAYHLYAERLPNFDTDTMNATDFTGIPDIL